MGYDLSYNYTELMPKEDSVIYMKDVYKDLIGQAQHQLFIISLYLVIVKSIILFVMPLWKKEISIEVGGYSYKLKEITSFVLGFIEFGLILYIFNIMIQI